MLRILDSISAPAYVRNNRMDVLAANRLGRALFTDAYSEGATAFNLTRYLLLDLVHPGRDHRQVPQIQDALPRGQPLTRRCQQQRELGVGMRGPHVLDPLHLPALARTTCTATAPEAVRTLRTKRETTPEGFHDEVLSLGLSPMSG